MPWADLTCHCPGPAVPGNGSSTVTRVPDPGGLSTARAPAERRHPVGQPAQPRTAAHPGAADDSPSRRLISIYRCLSSFPGAQPRRRGASVRGRCWPAPRSTRSTRPPRHRPGTARAGTSRDTGTGQSSARPGSAAGEPAAGKGSRMDPVTRSRRTAWPAPPRPGEHRAPRRQRPPRNVGGPGEGAVRDPGPSPRPAPGEPRRRSPPASGETRRPPRCAPGRPPVARRWPSPAGPRSRPRRPAPGRQAPACRE